MYKTLNLLVNSHQWPFVFPHCLWCFHTRFTKWCCECSLHNTVPEVAGQFLVTRLIKMVKVWIYAWISPSSPSLWSSDELLLPWSIENINITFNLPPAYCGQQYDANCTRQIARVLWMRHDNEPNLHKIRVCAEKNDNDFI